jgi:outer membrane lipoprotein SlyB
MEDDVPTITQYASKVYRRAPVIGFLWTIGGGFLGGALGNVVGHGDAASFGVFAGLLLGLAIGLHRVATLRLTAYRAARDANVEASGGPPE